MKTYLTNLYKTLQVKILLYYFYIVISLWIVNILSYNILLCTDVPNTVTEWVAKYDTVDTTLVESKSTPEALARWETKSKAIAEWKTKHGLTGPVESWYSIKIRYDYFGKDMKNPMLPNVPASLPLSKVDNTTLSHMYPYLSEDDYLADLRKRFTNLPIVAFYNPEGFPVHVSELTIKVLQELITTAEKATIRTAVLMGVPKVAVPNDILRTVIFEIVHQNQYTSSWVYSTQNDFNNKLTTYEMMLASLEIMLKTPGSYSPFGKIVLTHLETCIILINELTVTNEMDTYEAKVGSSTYTNLWNKIRDRNT